VHANQTQAVTIHQPNNPLVWSFKVDKIEFKNKFRAIFQEEFDLCFWVI